MSTAQPVNIDPLPVAKSIVITKVEEIHEERVDRAPLKPTKISKPFACEYPSVEPNVMRVRDPLPFPDKLHDLIGWTDAFVDRIAIVTRAQEKENLRKVTLLENEINLLRKTLETANIETQKACDGKAAAESKLKDTTEQLLKTKTVSAGKDKIIQDLKVKATEDAAKAAGKQKLLQEQNAALKIQNNIWSKTIEEQWKKLKKVSKKYEDEHDRWVEEHKRHLEDHTAYEKEVALFNKERDEKKAAQKERDEYKEKLAKVNIELDVKAQNICSLNDEIANLLIQSKEDKVRYEQLQKTLVEMQKELADKSCALEAAETGKTELLKQLEAAQKTIAKTDGNLKKALIDIEAHKQRINELILQKGKAESDLTEAKKANADTENKLREIARKALQEEKEAEQLLIDIKALHTKEVDHLRDELKEAESKYKDYEVVANMSSEELNNFKSWEAKAKALESKVKEAEANLVAIEIPKLHPKAKRFNILSVEYGGKSYVGSKDAKDQAVIDKLYDYANSGNKFKAENALFTDPWQGYQKSFSITYQVDGKGAPHHLFGKEHASTQFNL